MALSTQTSTIGELLADPAATAILDKHIPGLSTNGQIGMVKGQTLKTLLPMAGGRFTAETLAAIDAELAA